MFDRRHEKWVEEIAAHLELAEPLTASGAVMTFPAAVADLKDWVSDRRRYRGVQRDDWLQVIEDYRESLRWTGPKLTRLVEPDTAAIESLLRSLMTSRPDSIDEVSRSALVRQLSTLEAALRTPEATIAAWLDLISSAQNDSRTFEEISQRRDILWAIAYRRDLDVDRFGIFRRVREVLTDRDDAVHRELAKVHGVQHKFRFPPRSRPTGLATWERLQLCENVLRREAPRGDCVVWLRLGPASLHQGEANHGPVTFYQASFLAGYIAFPRNAEKMKFPPWEVLRPKGDPPYIPDGEVEWEHDFEMVYARVELSGIPPHAAEARARALVEGFTVVNHAAKGTWKLLNGSIIFVGGKRYSLNSWGGKEDLPVPFSPYYDWMGRDIDRMSRGNRTLDAPSLADLQDAIGMSAALNLAVGESPQATVLAAVRAIEHVNAWTTGGVKDWDHFAASHFKKSLSRIRFVQFMNSLNRYCMDSKPHYGPGAPVDAERELIDIRLKVKVDA